MNLTSIFNDFCKTVEDVKGTSQSFSALKTDNERVSFTGNLFSKFAGSLKLERVGKCSARSNEVRLQGNKHYEKNRNWDAVKMYTESIALAPCNSNELSLGYSNRAAALLRLNSPREALRDIENALMLPISSKLKEKLLWRKESCLNLAKSNFSNVEYNVTVPLLQRAGSQYFDSASEVVVLAENNMLGRHLTVNDDVKTGEVLIVEKPFSSILLPDHFYTHCSNCFKTSGNLMPCTNCCTSMFCSDECLRIAVRRYHVVECAILGYLTAIKVNRMELLAVRILIHATEQGVDLRQLSEEVAMYKDDVGAVYESQKHESLFRLVGNSEKRSVADLFARCVTVCILVHVLGSYSDFFKEEDPGLRMFAGGLLLGYLQSLPCNAHEVSEFADGGVVEIGAGAYATLSLVNHSCDPNVVRHCYGDVVALRSIRPIRRGDEIVDNYGYHYATHPLNIRQASLLKQYYFTCRCVACANHWPMYDDIPDKAPKLKRPGAEAAFKQRTAKFEVMLEEVLGGKFNSEVFNALCAYLDFLEEHVEKPFKAFNKCEEAIKHCLNFTGNHFRQLKGLP